MKILTFSTADCFHNKTATILSQHSKAQLHYFLSDDPVTFKTFQGQQNWQHELSLSGGYHCANPNGDRYLH